MGNKRNKRQIGNARKKQKPGPRHDANLSTQPLRPMPHAKIRHVQHNAEDRTNHRMKIEERKLSKWQKTLLDENCIASNWVGRDGNFHLDFRLISSNSVLFI